MGSSRQEYWVSSVSLCQSRGPMPMENSLTRTPQSFAAMKWPNSWTATRTPKIRIAARIYTMVMPKLLFQNLAHTRDRTYTRAAASAASTSSRDGFPVTGTAARASAVRRAMS